MPKVMLSNAQDGDSLYYSPYNPALSAILDAGIISMSLNALDSENREDYHEVKISDNNQKKDMEFRQSIYSTSLWLNLPIFNTIGLNLG